MYKNKRDRGEEEENKQEYLMDYLNSQWERKDRGQYMPYRYKDGVF